MALLGGSGERGHLAHARHGHLEGARDGRGGHREDVDVGIELLEGFLVFDAEALLLVHHHEPEVLESHVSGEEPVGADDDVDRAVGQPLDGLGGLAFGLEARKLGQMHGEARIPLAESLVMLGDEQRGGHEDGRLLAVLHRFESRPQGDLGFAVADVAGYEPVHRRRLFHVRLDFVDGLKLVWRFDVGEGVFELALPGGVGRELESLGRLARGVEPHELLSDLLGRRPRAGLGFGPVASAHFVEGGGLAAGVP